MTFTQNIEKKFKPLRQAILRHPFITGVGQGTLDVEKFKFYVRQDYLYLIDYSRILALASANAPDLDTIGWFARLLHETLGVEMELHRGYCAEFGITRRELEETPVAPTTQSYTAYLSMVAYQHTFHELVAALLPCQWGYWEIGDHLIRRGLPENAPLYSKWIKMYASNEFKSLADWTRSLADRLGEDASSKQVQDMEKAYLTSLRYEYLFWDMPYAQETWPI